MRQIRHAVEVLGSEGIVLATPPAPTGAGGRVEPPDDPHAQAGSNVPYRLGHETERNDAAAVALGAVSWSGTSRWIGRCGAPTGLSRAPQPAAPQRDPGISRQWATASSGSPTAGRRDVRRVSGELTPQVILVSWPCRDHGALALVGSPAQLLNVIELARRDRVLPTSIAVLAPTEGPTRMQLRSMTRGRKPGTVGWHEPRLVARRSPGIRALAALAGIERLVVGDPYSGDQVIIASPGRGGHDRRRRNSNVGFARQCRRGTPFGGTGSPPRASDVRSLCWPGRIAGNHAAGCPGTAADCGSSPACRSICPVELSPTTSPGTCELPGHPAEDCC
jgi:hypothetical protein